MHAVELEKSAEYVNNNLLPNFIEHVRHSGWLPPDLQRLCGSIAWIGLGHGVSFIPPFPANHIGALKKGKAA